MYEIKIYERHHTRIYDESNLQYAIFFQSVFTTCQAQSIRSTVTVVLPYRPLIKYLQWTNIWLKSDRIGWWQSFWYYCRHHSQPVLSRNPDLNVYDIRKKCDGAGCYDETLLEQYLNSPEVQKQLGTAVKWVECDEKVHTALGIT